MVHTVRTGQCVHGVVRWVMTECYEYLMHNDKTALWNSDERKFALTDYKNRSVHIMKKIRLTMATLKHQIDLTYVFAREMK